MNNKELGGHLLRFLRMVHILPFERGIAPPIAVEIRRVCLGLEGLLESEMGDGLPVGDPLKSLSDKEIDDIINSWPRTQPKKKHNSSRDEDLEEYYMTHT